jgi:hypothetical protein
VRDAFLFHEDLRPAVDGQVTVSPNGVHRIASALGPGEGALTLAAYGFLDQECPDMATRACGGRVGSAPITACSR